MSIDISKNPFKFVKNSSLLQKLFLYKTLSSQILKKFDFEI